MLDRSDITKEDFELSNVAKKGLANARKTPLSKYAELKFSSVSRS